MTAKKALPSSKSSATAKSRSVSENRTAHTAQKTAQKAAPKKDSYIPSENEKYMNKKHLRYFKKILEDMRVEILANNERLVDAIKDDVQALPDENDRASKESEFTVELRERERERRLLNKVDSALARVTNNNFGYCKECGDKIGLQRLLARPVATLCIECKNLQETYEKSGVSLDFN